MFTDEGVLYQITRVVTDRLRNIVAYVCRHGTNGWRIKEDSNPYHVKDVAELVREYSEKVEKKG